MLFLLFTKKIQMRKGIVGGNMEGFFKNFSDSDVPSYQKISIPLGGRFPGGADAKEALMSTDVVGLGKDFDYLKWWYSTYKTDENGNSSISDEEIQKDVDTDALQTESNLHSLVYFSTIFPDFEVIYNLNIFSHKYFGEVAINQQLNNISFLIDSGVKVKGIVAGNELYFVVKTFEEYKNLFEPLYEACKIQFPEIPFGLCISPDIVTTPSSWNINVFNYINAHSESLWAVDTHLYYNNKKLTESTNLFNTLIPTGQITIVEPNQENSSLKAIFDQFVIDYKASINYHSQFADYVEENIPNAQLWMSEFGCIPAEYWSNTIAQGANLFESLIKNSNRFDYYLMHNLQGSWLWGAISKSDDRLDLNTTGKENLERVGFWALQLFSEMDSPIFLDSYDLNIQEPGVYYLAYTNISNPPVTGVLLNGFEDMNIKSVVNRFVKGEHLYSASGKTGFYTKESIQTFDVSGIQENHIMFPEPNAFGYIRIELEEIPVELPEKPIANAGVDETVSLNQEGIVFVELSGIESIGIDALIKSYNWLNTSNGQRFYGELPTVQFVTPGVYVFELVVVDYNGLQSEPDTVTITVNAYSSECTKCKSFWYRIFNYRKCKNCK